MSEEIQESNEPKFGLQMIVLQPTTFCNLDCKYCYLPDKSRQRIMPVRVTERVANFIDKDESPVKTMYPLRIVWHGGEPLACGINRFRDLVAPLTRKGLENKVRHNVQTNATLLNDDWCSLFKEYGFKVGISIDGPAELNAQRIDRNGKSSYTLVMKGIDCLHHNDIPFSIISVVTNQSLDSAKEIYKFARLVDCASLCVNIEEKEGVNLVGLQHSERVSKFWKDLFEIWIANPIIRVREFDNALVSIKRVYSELEQNSSKTNEEMSGYMYFGILPSIASNGDVVLLSPEFIGVPADKNYNFVVGNILDHSLREVLQKGLESNYVKDFVLGVKRCKNECAYYKLCKGGQASNKYFEHKTTAATETDFCRNTKKALFDAVIDSI